MTSDRQKNYWVVRLGKGNEYAETCHKRRIIAVGWRELDLDLSQYANLDQRTFTKDIGDMLSKVMHDKTEKYLSGSARQLYKFAMLIKPGDVVICPANSEGLKYIGIVRGEYAYADPDADLPYRHRRSVEWVAEVDKSAFSEGLRNSSGAILTVFNVSKFGEEIEGLMGKSGAATPEGEVEDLKEFGMESHLEDFIVENWDKLEAFEGYDVYEEDGEVVGQQYNTNIGRIDILAHSKNGKKWLVIELKKGKTSDDVVGQTLRYIGWIKRNEANPGDEVRGIIIAGEKDERLDCALETLDHVSLMTYSVNFNLKRLK